MSSAPPRIRELAVEGYRGLRSARLTFADGQLTVLVGKNGAGKSAMLDCMTLLFQRLFTELSGSKSARNWFRPTDISNDRGVVRCSVRFGVEPSSAWLDGRRTYVGPVEEFVWSLEGERDTRKVADTNAKARRQSVRQLRQLVAAPYPSALPLTVSYGPDRATINPLAPPSETAPDPFSSALSPGKSNFQELARWFRDREDFENQVRARKGAGHSPELPSVRRAITAMLPGFDALRVERRPPPARLTIDKNGAPLVLDQLSHGERTLLALVADVAWRLTDLAEPGQDPFQYPAWIFIDEVELHLHPGWQRRVLPLLLETFPRCQFIVTTHSPQVLASIPASAIRILERHGGDLSVKEPDAAFGLDSNRILMDVLDDVDRPIAIRTRFAEIYRLIHAGNLAGAREHIASLAHDIGDQDPEITRTLALVARREILGRE